MPHSPGLAQAAWRRLGRLIWPFLAATFLIVGAACASLYVVGAARAYVEGESLWSKGQKDAVQHLVRFSHSCRPADFEAYRRQMLIPLGDRQARLALLASPPDLERAAGGFLAGGNHPEEVPGMIFLFRWLGWTPPFREIVRIWADADVLLLGIDELARQLQAEAAGGNCGLGPARDEALEQILTLNDRLTPLQREFSQRLGETNRLINRVLTVAMTLTALLLCALGVAVSLRAVRREVAVELKLGEELQHRRAAMATLRRVLHRAGSREAPPASVADDIEALTGEVERLTAREIALSERLSSTLTLHPDALVSLDEHGRIVYVSGALQAITGLAPAAVRDESMGELYERLRDRAPRRSPWPELATLRRRLELGPVDLEVDGPLPKTVQLELRRGDSAPGVRHVLVLRDVSRERSVERMKSEFIAAAAHELRTPLTSIHGAVELLLLRTPLNARQRDLLDLAQRQSTLMTRILQDLLDVERLEQGGAQELLMRPLDLRELLVAAVQAYPVPQGRELPALQLPSGDWRVKADADKLQQVVNNLLSNAFKYSQSGAVTVTLQARSGADGHAEIGLAVGDRGIGMTPDQLQRLGERFYRADQSGNVAGTGLGFNIVRQICELHGGRVQVESEPGTGTLVTCWLPRDTG